MLTFSFFFFIANNIICIKIKINKIECIKYFVVIIIPASEVSVPSKCPHPVKRIATLLVFIIFLYIYNLANSVCTIIFKNKKIIIFIY